MKTPLVLSSILGLSICPFTQCQLCWLALTLAMPTAVVAETAQQQAERHNARGDKLFQANDFRGALAEFSRAIELDPSNAQFYFNRGYVKFKSLEDFTGARQDLDRAIQLKPSFTEAYGVRAYVRLKLNDYKGSLVDYDKAIAGNPQWAAMWQERALLKQAYLKDLPGALRDFDKAIELAPTEAMNYAFRGLVKRDLGQREGAIADFRKCLALARSQNNGDLVTMMQGNLRNLGASE
jgi:tetratricopeptide (TPR) repeat protein